MTLLQEGRVGVCTLKGSLFYKNVLKKQQHGEVRCGDHTIGDFVTTSFMDDPMQANLLHIELLSDR